jgi:phosphoribosyl 1,2-cyclic phosphodiesterase
VLNVTFYGVRGSTPCSGPTTERYGGNTSCVALEVPGEDPIVLDLGTGLRYFGATQPLDGTFRGHALVSHLHWDHVQGLPFFVPVLREGASFDIYAPVQDEYSSVDEAFRVFFGPPYFPIKLEQLPGHIRMHDLPEGTRRIGGAEVTTREVPHLGRTNGYRIAFGGATVAYLSDHQMPLDGSHQVGDGALELCDGADLVIHDAQYTPAEFVDKAHWGHCTVEYAVFVAAKAGAKRLALFHHDPLRSDDALDEVAAMARACGESHGIEVVAASEGLTISLTGA